MRKKPYRVIFDLNVLSADKINSLICLKDPQSVAGWISNSKNYFTSKFLSLSGGITRDRGSFLPGDAQRRCNFPRINVSFISCVVTGFSPVSMGRK